MLEKGCCSYWALWGILQGPWKGISWVHIHLTAAYQRWKGIMLWDMQIAEQTYSQTTSMNDNDDDDDEQITIAIDHGHISPQT